MCEPASEQKAAKHAPSLTIRKNNRMSLPFAANTLIRDMTAIKNKHLPVDKKIQDTQQIYLMTDGADHFYSPEEKSFLSSDDSSNSSSENSQINESNKEPRATITSTMWKNGMNTLIT